MLTQTFGHSKTDTFFSHRLSKKFQFWFSFMYSSESLQNSVRGSKEKLLLQLLGSVHSSQISKKKKSDQKFQENTNCRR